MTRHRSPETEAAVDRALARMAKDIVPVEDAAHEQARRARLVPELSRFTDDVFERRKSRRRFLVPLLAASVVLTAGLTIAGLRVFHATDPSLVGVASVRAAAGVVRLDREGKTPSRVDDRRVALGARDRVETTDGRAEVDLVSGAAVEVAPMSQLELGSVTRTADAVDERIAVTSGHIRVRVPKLSHGSRLVVGTPEAIVTVHGTDFVVEVTPATSEKASVTSVSVTEGRVSVVSRGREIFLGPGAHWSSAPEPVKAAAPEAPVGERGEPSAASGAPSSAVRASPVRKSTLADENALFRAAITARSDGNPRLAIERFDALLARFPSSPLAPVARAEKARALADIKQERVPHSP